MLLDKGCKLDKCLPKAGHRLLSMESAHLDVEAGKIIATDGRVLAAIPVTVTDGDTSGPVSKEALKAHKGAMLSCNGSLDVTGGPSYPRPDLQGVDFPDWTKVVPDYEGVETRRIRLNVKLLWNLVQALGCEAVELEIADAMSAVVVRPVSTPDKGAPYPDALGVIMPITS